MADWYLEH